MVVIIAVVVALAILILATIAQCWLVARLCALIAAGQASGPEADERPPPREATEPAEPQPDDSGLAAMPRKPGRPIDEPTRLRGTGGRT